jgi:hypothetical protein
VPKAWRENLESAGFQIGRAPVHTAVQAKDGTAKVNVLSDSFFTGVGKAGRMQHSVIGLKLFDNQKLKSRFRAPSVCLIRFEGLGLTG